MYLVVLATSFVVLVKKLKKAEPSETLIGAQPISVREAHEFVTKRDHEKLETDLRELRKENVLITSNLSKDLNSGINGIHKLMKSDIDGLHNRVTDLFGAFREMKGAVENALKESRTPFHK